MADYDDQAAPSSPMAYSKRVRDQLVLLNKRIKEREQVASSQRTIPINNNYRYRTSETYDNETDQDNDDDHYSSAKEFLTPGNF